MQISFHSLHIWMKEKNAAQRRCRVNSLFSRVRGVKRKEHQPYAHPYIDRVRYTGPIEKRMNCGVWLAVLWLFLFEQVRKNRKNTEKTRFIDIPERRRRFDDGQSIYTPRQGRDIYPSSETPSIA